MKSQNSQRSSGRIEDMSEEQLDSAVLKVMFYLLSDMRNMKKVRKEEIVTNVLEKSSRQYATIMKRVEHNLSKTFGLLLVKLPDANDAFIIVNKHQSKFIELTKDLNTTSDVQENLILTIVLSAIFMNRGQMYESQVITLLRTAGLLNPKFFGQSNSYSKTEDYVKRFVSNVCVKKMYLEAKSVDRPDQQQNPPLEDDGKKTVNLLSWGFRALIEVDIQKIEAYIRQMYEGKNVPAFPVSYYKELKTKQEHLRSQVYSQ